MGTMDFDASRALMYRKPYGGDLRRVVAVATETDGHGGDFVRAAMLDQDLGAAPRIFSTCDALLSAFFVRQYRGAEMLLHNADYSLRYMLPSLEAMSKAGAASRFIVNGAGQIIHVKVTLGHNTWYIRDTYALMPLDLEELGPLAGYTGEELTLEKSARVILRAYLHFASVMLKEWGIRPGPTIGNTAMSAFQSTLRPGDLFYRQRDDVETMGRDAYFGGLTFFTTRNPVGACVKIDANAMYPAAMRAGVPTRSGAGTDIEYRDLPGIYDCEVYAPPTIPFAFVPYRDSITYETMFPRNSSFRTTLCSHTIALARQAGYTIRVTRGYVFDGIEDIFTPFVDKCAALEQRFSERGARLVIKVLRNALYGKFGMRSEVKEYYLTSSPDDDMTPLQTFEGIWVENLYYRDVHIERPYMFPTWAAWITATARNVHAQAVMDIGPKDCYYGDTDSIVCTRPALDAALQAGKLEMGAGYGQWKVEAEYKRFRVLGGKQYIGYTNGGADWRFKGIPRRAISPEQLEKMLPGVTLETEKYTVLPRAINTTGGRAISEETVKHVSLGPEYNDQPWQVADLTE